MTGTLTVSNAPSLGKGRITQSITLSGMTQLSHDRPDGTMTFARCVAGETRGELSVQVHLRSDEMVVATPTLRLYEGSSCNSNDLDGTSGGLQQGIRQGGRSPSNWELYVKNGEAGSPDYARVNFSVSQKGSTGIGIGSPAEPSNVVATRDAADPTRVNLEWTDTATDETRFEIFNSTLQQARGVPANSTSFVWTGLPPAKQCFQVRAVNDVGPSDWTPFNSKVECA
ncbi:fibronectin type III domain-containing protein [Streptomyces sp. NPDC004126]|uniref:fibronectin type III domain-containing protein n=1 Tax=Streptomyces sp. NPDC004126 TaxID=3390695 RepID=UPI003CFDA805